MEINSNLPDFIANLQRIRDAVANGGASGTADFSDALFGAINAGMGAMKVRIFNQGLDANGDAFGKYVGRTTQVTAKKYKLKKYANNGNKATLRKNLKEDAQAGQGYTEYEKLRLANGRQIGKKDLQFSGSLKSSIEAVKKDRKAQVVITNPENALIASYQEQQIGNIRSTGKGRGGAKPAPIFQFSKEEFDRTKVEGVKLITQVIQQIINNR